MSFLSGDVDLPRSARLNPPYIGRDRAPPPLTTRKSIAAAAIGFSYRFILGDNQSRFAIAPWDSFIDILRDSNSHSHVTSD
jgi:hypothetical protein